VKRDDHIRTFQMVPTNDAPVAPCRRRGQDARGSGWPLPLTRPLPWCLPSGCFFFPDAHGTDSSKEENPVLSSGSP